MHAQKGFGGRARQDTFFGHKGGVRCLALLPSCNIMATGLPQHAFEFTSVQKLPSSSMPEGASHVGQQFLKQAYKVHVPRHFHRKPCSTDEQAAKLLCAERTQCPASECIAFWVVAGSLDRTVKLWDLNAGLQIATSRLQPSAVRTLALDASMLVCSASKVNFCAGTCLAYPHM